MISRVPLGLLLLSGTLFVSCQVYPDPRAPRSGPQAPMQDPAAKDKQELQKLREEKKRLEAEKKEQENKINDPGDGGTPPPERKEHKDTKTTKDYPVAGAVPGKDGFVFSPYNNKMVDVRSISSGTLVRDPTYPAEDKKYFRVP